MFPVKVLGLIPEKRVRQRGHSCQRGDNNRRWGDIYRRRGDILMA